MLNEAQEILMADLVPPAGFEPASTGLKDRGPVPLDEGGNVWSGQRESNPRPTVWKTAALPLSYTRVRRRRTLGRRCRLGFLLFVAD